MENGKLDVVTIEDEIPAGLEYVQGSIRFEGAEPNPIELKWSLKSNRQVSRNYRYERT